MVSTHVKQARDTCSITSSGVLVPHKKNELRGACNVANDVPPISLIQYISTDNDKLKKHTALERDLQL